MSKGAHRRRRVSQPVDHLVGEFTSRLRYAPKNFYAEVYRLKAQTPAEQLFAAFPALFRSPDALDEIHGVAFPTLKEGLFDKPALYRAGQRPKRGGLGRSARYVARPENTSLRPHARCL